MDSGADTSALPLSYIDVGESCSHETIGQDYIDAQGGKLDIRDTRLATLDLGNGVVLRERFLVANISCPLLALGHIIKAGWELQHSDDGVCLVKRHKFVNVHFKRNSLCVHGCIRMISQDDVISPKGSEPSLPAVRAIHLERVVRRLVPGWNKISPQLYAITTRRARFVDTTVCPSTELMWLRTTLVCRNGQGWELLENCEPISELDDMEGEIYDPERILEVLTLAHVHCVPSEELGFRIIEGDGRPIFDDDVQHPDESQEPQPVQETPADVPEAEQLEEDRAIPYEDETTVIVDGIVFTLDSPLRGLRAGCTSLRPQARFKEGLYEENDRISQNTGAHRSSISAGQTQTGRKACHSSRQACGTLSAVRDAHNLTYEPYETWCSLWVANRVRQDGHRVQTHETTSHSVISFDVFYCSCMKNESNNLAALVVSNRDTGLCLALPTQQKGGKSLPYLTTELCRFSVHCGHTEVALRCDSEPSTLSWLDSVKRARAGMRITVHSEPFPTGDHQSNGAAEAMSSSTEFQLTGLSN